MDNPVDDELAQINERLAEFADYWHEQAESWHAKYVDLAQAVKNLASV